MNMFTGKNIVLGVTGCSTAHKAVDLAEAMGKRGANVDVVMTRNATQFVTPVSFRRPTNNPVSVDLFAEPTSWDRDHKPLAEKADLLIIAPATANIIAKAAHGIADDMLSTLILSTGSKVLIAPHMNPRMYTKPVVVRNVKTLKEDGFVFVEGEKKLPDGKVIRSVLASVDDIVKEAGLILELGQ